MDNIVRLTKAERGFLMLRDEKGEMVTRMGRNWEMESINSSELTVSKSVVGRVIEYRRTSHHHQCAGRPALYGTGKHCGIQPALHFVRTP